MAICKNKKCSIGECEQTENCSAYVPVMSNADHIRSISDEELADALQKFCIAMVDCSDCPLYAFGCPMSSTFNDWLEWLQKPAGIA